MVTLGVFGTALLYGDGLITPAISVLSAVEGFEVATPAFERLGDPDRGGDPGRRCSSIQQRGTAGIAKVFSPIMVVWFTVLGVLGISQIRQRAGGAAGGVADVRDRPLRRASVEGVHRARLDLPGRHRRRGAVRRHGPLRPHPDHAGRGTCSCCPACVLNYFGQAALLSSRPMDHIEELSPFYEMAPDWAIWPLAILATMATVIASQALISGAFSLTVQAVQLDYLPRLAILHTSERHIGQVYVPLVNWLLMIGCVGLVVVFRTSTALAAAYGIAVTTTMLITTLIFYRFVRDKWHWSASQGARDADPVPDRRCRVPRRPTCRRSRTAVGSRCSSASASSSR